jgi:hypothetical protein
MDTSGEVKTDVGQSVGMEKLAAALAKAQGMFEQPKNIKRGQQGHRTFKYAPLPEIYRAIRPGLSQNELVDVSYWEEIGGKLYMTTELRHSGGGVMASRWPVSGTTDPQERGKEGTYGRRNNICALTGVVGEELDADDGDGDGGGDPERGGQDAKRKEAEKRLDALKGKGQVRSAYDGKELAPGEATLPEERTGKVETADCRPETADRRAEPEKTTLTPALSPLREREQSAARATPPRLRSPGSTDPTLKNGNGQAARGGQTPSPQPSPLKGEGVDPLAGIVKPLADLMRKDGITPEVLKAYYVARGHVTDNMEPTALPPDYVAGLTKPENWKQALERMKGGGGK